MTEKNENISIPVESKDNEKPAQSLGNTLGGFVILGILAFLFMKGFDWYVHNDVIDQATAQYEISKRNGNLSDICVQASTVVAAYLQAEDEPNFAKWKITRDSECGEAGIPIQ